MTAHRTEAFPLTRMATIDVLEMGKRRHHITALIELDVSLAREKIRQHNSNGAPRISLTAWLISVVGTTLKAHETAAAFRSGKNKRIIFNDINVSLLVEKEVGGERVPFPLLIEKAQSASPAHITRLISEAKEASHSDKDLVLKRKSGRMERLYPFLPACLRRMVWRFLLSHPKFAYGKIGNVAITGIGMMGKVNGWFIPTAIHPIAFGIGSVVKKPVVKDEAIVIREMLQMTVLLDHDVIDGAQMARFVSSLAKNIENAFNL